jgi:dehydrogenase/reductase SDR family protein 1
MSQPLKGKVALVTGASRGIGKGKNTSSNFNLLSGIAFELAKAGVTVYATGRPANSRDQIKSAGTLNDLVNESNKVGGTIIPILCDHTKDEQVKELFERINREQSGRLDLLVNNAVSNVIYAIKNIGKKFFEITDDPGYTWDVYNNCGLRGNYICSVFAARLMVPRKSGLIITIGSPGSLKYLFSVVYGVQKEAVRTRFLFKIYF